MDVNFNIAPLNSTIVKVDVNSLQQLIIPVNVTMSPDNIINVAVEKVEETNTVVNVPEEDLNTQSYFAEFDITLGDGTSGASAYQSWLNGGNIGTEAEFIESLRGPSGFGVPLGGEAEQVLLKSSSNDYDSEWSSLPNLTLIFENRLI